MSIYINKENIILGINWGAIPEKGWFGATQLNGVDLDMCCFEIDQNNNCCSSISWEEKLSSWGTMSQDDMTGDMMGDDQQDNEWIVIDLKKVPKNHKLILTVINYTEQSISDLFHFDYRIYSGVPNNVNDLFYFKNMKEISITKNAKGVFFGLIENTNDRWIYHNKEIPLDELSFNQQFEKIRDSLTKTCIS